LISTMSAKDCEGLSKEEFDDLCKRVKEKKDKDAKDAKDAKKRIDDIISAEEKKDPKKAFELLKAFCDNTDGKKGAYTVGLVYLRGEVVPRNGKEAAKYFHWAVENGNAAGLRGLRLFYDEGYIREEFLEDPKDDCKNPRRGLKL